MNFDLEASRYLKKIVKTKTSEIIWRNLSFSIKSMLMNLHYNCIIVANSYFLCKKLYFKNFPAYIKIHATNKKTVPLQY